MVSQSDTMPLFANNYLMQMTETGVRWVVLGFPQDGACTDLFENLSEISLKGDLSNATTFNPALFSLVNTFNDASFKSFKNCWKYFNKYVKNGWRLLKNVW